MPVCQYACGSAEHMMSRRGFLGGTALGAAAALGPIGFGNAEAAESLAQASKRVLVIYLAGGVSQLETWDPKPGTDTGGPFRAIPTSVPGTHFCELLPETAKQAHRLAVVRSINIHENSHSRGRTFMLTGRKEEPAFTYPHLGAVAAKLLNKGVPTGLPGHLHIFPARGGGGGNRPDAAFLGPQYSSVPLADGSPPAGLLPPTGLTSAADQAREALRQKLDRQFLKSRRTAATEAYTGSFGQAEEVIRRADVFDVSREPAKLAEKYGTHDFGRHLLLSRRLLEAGVNYVKVTHTNYDTHHENFDFHIEQLGEFDRPFAALLQDLTDRGMLASTLVIVMSEFGRTPRINDRYGRDHWGTAWSVALAGAGIKGGAVVGKTNANGTAVTDREVHGGHLFHTYLQAVGLDSTTNFYPDNRPVPVADPEVDAISEILA
ncbi:MAG: DUF1501 domain-containing protein [Bacteroidales bacterium]|nr:DUF1501 domain-containing protein [Bacteroidales bacterium]